MKKYLIIIILVILSFFLGFFIADWFKKSKIETPIIQINPRTLDKYSFENLSNTAVPEPKIELGEIIKEEKAFTSYLFTFSFDPTLSKGVKKNVSGLINIPKGTGSFPVIVMFRGYVDQKIYQTGMGIQRAGEYFAQNGFITIAPDFLGYGSSDSESSDIFESRFQTYTTAISLMNSISSINQWNQNDVFLWGHSNGGHVALATLEITGKDYPTVLWAPVSQSFPYSILYYLDEVEDGGKLIIQELSDFFDLYDPKLYSITNYFARINKETAIQLHQGGADEAVPYKWSSNLSKILKNNEIKVNYFYYPGADHNLQPNWNQAVARDLFFYKSLIK